MTSKSDIINAGFDSLKNNSSGNPDVDRDIGIAGPEEIYEIAHQAGGGALDASKPKVPENVREIIDEHRASTKEQIQSDPMEQTLARMRERHSA